jgi:hypothetical protein
MWATDAYMQMLRNFDPFTGLPEQLLDSLEFPNFPVEYFFSFVENKQKLEFQKLHQFTSQL